MPKASVHPYMPTNGVRDDFLAVMNEFLELKTVRFSNFSEIWRSRKMSFLCAGRHTDRETREFLERSFLIALDFFLPPYQFQVRVGGLYLLYSMHITQPIVPGVKIRLTQGQWRDSMRFQREAAQQNHLDVVYVFNKLLQDHAFQFCYTPSEMSTRPLHRESESSTVNLAEDMKDDRRDIDRLFNYEAMEQLSYLLDHYQQMKVNLAGPEATQPDKSLDVVQGKMVEDLVSMLQSFKMRLNNIQRYGKAEPQPVRSQEEQQQAVETTGSRRQALKAKAFSELKTYGGRSNFVLSVEGDSPSTSVEKQGPSTEEIQEKSPVDQETMYSVATHSSKTKKGGKGARRVKAKDALSGTSPTKKTTKRKRKPRKNQASPESKMASMIGDDVILVELYSNSTIKSPEEEVNLKPSTSFHHYVPGEVSSATTRLEPSNDTVDIKKAKFQFDAPSFRSCLGGKGTKVTFRDVEDTAEKGIQSVSQGIQCFSNDYVSKVLRFEKPKEKIIRKQPETSCLEEPCLKKGSKKLSNTTDSGSANKKRVRGKKEPAPMNEQWSDSKKRSQKMSSKKRTSSAKESQDAPHKECLDDESDMPHGRKSTTSKRSEESAISLNGTTGGQKRKEISDHEDSFPSSNKFNEVCKVQNQKKRRRRGKSPEAQSDGNTQKSPLKPTFVHEVDDHSKEENFESPRRVDELEVPSTNLEREESEKRGTGIYKITKKKVAVRRPNKEKQKFIEKEQKLIDKVMETASRTSGKRKRSLNKSNEHSLDASVGEYSSSPPKKITPSKLKKNLSSNDSPIKGGKIKSNQKEKPGSSPVRKVNKSPASNANTSTPSSSKFIPFEVRELRQSKDNP